MDSQTLQTTIAGQRFMCTTGQVSIAAVAETALVYLQNAGSKNGLLSRLRIGLNSTTVGTLISLYQNPAPSANGTALTVVNGNFGSGTAATLAAFKSPTAATKGTLIAQFLYLGNSQQPDKDFLAYITPGKSLLITVTNSAATAVNIHADLEWIEQ